jgi:hypothetical protein
VAVEGETVAVNVTDELDADGFIDDVSATDEFALFTVCERADELLLLQFESPA